MSLRTAIGRQLRHPAGPGGWTIGQLMRLVNARPNALAIDALRLRTGDDVLELGCGPGHGLQLMAAIRGIGTIHGVDQSATMLAQARSRNRAAVLTGRIQLHQADFLRLPLPDASVDKVLAVNVAYFWHDTAAVFSEVRRVLRPHGALTVYVTDAATMQDWPMFDHDTHRLFGMEELRAALREGFADGDVDVSRVPVMRGVDGLVATVTPVPGH